MNASRTFLVVLILVLACLLAACDGAVPPGGPYVWIDVPTDGLRVEVGQEVRIEGHASHRGGIARVEIWVNGEPHLVEENPPTQGNLAHFDQLWMPPGAGEYTVEVVAVGVDGAESAPDSVHLYVGAEVAQATPVPTATPVETEEPPTDIPPPEETEEPPTATPPPTAVPTPVPDTTAPPTPLLLKPLNGVELACTSQVMLRWNSVSDPSGVKYRVQVERHAGSENWQPVSGSPWTGLTDTELELDVECGWYYRWRVRAVDGEGNAGSFSDWFEFADLLG